MKKSKRSTGPTASLQHDHSEQETDHEVAFTDTAPEEATGLVEPPLEQQPPAPEPVSVETSKAASETATEAAPAKAAPPASTEGRRHGRVYRSVGGGARIRTS